MFWQFHSGSLMAAHSTYYTTKRSSGHSTWYIHLIASLSEKDDNLQSCGNSLGRLTLSRLLESRGTISNARRSNESSQVSMLDLISCNLAERSRGIKQKLDNLKRVLTCLFPLLCPLDPLPVCSFPCL